MRVIAGRARGRALRPPAGEAARPTSDLIKGVIFSMLEAEAYKRGFEPDEDGALAAALAWPRVLDLFAGSGALGIEALSRGARHADFVDDDAEAARAIHANLVSTGLLERATLHRQPVAVALGRLDGPFDLVLADPPYADEAEVARLVEALDARPLVGAAGVLVLEQSAASRPPAAIAGLRLAGTRRHGRTRVSLYMLADARGIGSPRGEAEPHNAVDSDSGC
jgi:16S rRNA (guanine966-N2)-methyltransferase